VSEKVQIGTTDDPEFGTLSYVRYVWQESAFFNIEQVINEVMSIIKEKKYTPEYELINQ